MEIIYVLFAGIISAIMVAMKAAWFYFIWNNFMTYFDAMNMGVTYYTSLVIVLVFSAFSYMFSRIQTKEDVAFETNTDVEKVFYEGINANMSRQIKLAILTLVIYIVTHVG